MKRARILVVDDKTNFLSLFRRILPADTELVCAADGTRALELLATQRFDVVITDVRMPGGASGIDVLHKVRATSETTAVVLMTAYGTITEAVRAMKLGADDYLTKPFDTDDALAVIGRALERRRARGGVPVTHDGSHPLLGQSRAIVDTRERVDRAARSELNVMLVGEAGTGKDFAAARIHQEGRRRARPLVTHESRTSTEHRLGADFEEAAGGTLYLDGVAEMPPGAQARLGQLLEERARRGMPPAASARVVSSLRVDIGAAEALRAPVLARLGEIRIDLPPLRSRPEDIAQLTSAFLARLPNQGLPRAFSPKALEALEAYDWPGNVRQLRAVVLAATAVGTGPMIEVDDLPMAVGGGVTTSEVPPPLASLRYRDVLAAGRDRTTREYLVALLGAVHGNVTQAAERAGVERETFHRLLKRHGLRAEDFRTRSG